MINNFFTSGKNFDESQRELKSRYQMVNIAIVTSAFGLLFGILVNFIKDIHGYIAIESFIILINIILFIMLRYVDSAFSLVSTMVTAQFTFLFLFLIYVGEPQELKHLWLLTYPIILLFFQKKKNALYWLSVTFLLLLIAPAQPFIEIKYSVIQIVYLSAVLLVVSLIIYFYQIKMDEAKDLILQQQKMLLGFNANLEKEVKVKTTELVELNESLENKVQDKIEELIQKDKILTVQSKQAVMGEMISMIAHQWRQPLSTITLQISNLQLKSLLGQRVTQEEVDDALSRISDTIMYLSDTVDDFQTYFHQDKEIVEVEIHELLQKAVNFTLSRVKDREIDTFVLKDGDIYIKTYINELIQVVLNILNNAIDAHNETNFKDPFIKLSVKEVGDNIWIYVEDNAGGIEEENLPKLFEPYFSTKGKNGTGLGLYMSNMIIQKQFNGEISVKVSKNFTTFIIKVPKDIS
ncbi:MAG: HAMP domain-containing histidine kinase [Sulfurimonas sp.]|nr:HAMP domain-containing histidine kinase [Sulfurimonas sp.]